MLKEAVAELAKEPYVQISPAIAARYTKTDAHVPMEMRPFLIRGLTGGQTDITVVQSMQGLWVKATGSDDSDKVLAQMKKTPVNDIFAKGGFIRGDGRMVHDMYLMQVKTPDKSTEPWDYYNVVQTFKGEQAWTTKAESKCALWK